MKRIAAGIGALAILLIAGVLIWSFVLPALNQKKAAEKLEDIKSPSSQPNSTQAPATKSMVETMEPQIMRAGSFKPLNSKQSSGEVKIIKSGEKYFVRLEDNFSVTNGPDLYVGFGANGKVDSSSLIARLKANRGGQNYELPTGFDPQKYDQVFIHCKAFSYSFAVADLSM